MVGQAGFADRLGRRALVWGAVGGLIPDLDVLAMTSQDPFAEFIYHRGFTHSLWFGPLAGPLIGWAIWRFYRWRGRSAPGEPGEPAALSAWMGLMALALLTHPLIDVFTSYGTQLLAPFSRARFALDAVAIVDFTYSGILVAGLVFGCLLHRRGKSPRATAMVALVLSWSYLGYGWWLNEEAETQIAQELVASGHPPDEVNSYPTFVQPYLRRFVARSGNQIWVGLHTPLGGGVTRWEQFEATRPHPLVARLLATPRGEIFDWFAMGEVAARVIPDPQGFAVEIDDLRYGFPENPQRGMWGIRGVFDSDQQPIGRVERIHLSRPSGLSLGSLWNAMRGDFSTLLGQGA